MSTPGYAGSRLRAYMQFLAAFLYFFLAKSIAAHGAQGLVRDAWQPLVGQAMLVFLLSWLCGHGPLARPPRLIPSAPRDFQAPGLATRSRNGIGDRLGLALVCVCP